MKVISFDVGIKNMAYCILDIEPNTPISISKWNVLNMVNTLSIKPLCSCIIENKKRKTKSKTTCETVLPLCNKIAKYRKNDLYFCQTHAKSSSYKIPDKECSPQALKKMKMDALLLFCRSHMILANDSGIPISQLLKKDILELCNRRFENIMLEAIKPVKEKNASETDLITIGRKMKELLDNIPELNEVTHVVIENQISPIANRMKTIQGMLAQYFIMKCSPTTVIEFVSSANKLKGFVSTEDENATAGATAANDKTKYKQHKSDGIKYCTQFLTNNRKLKEWESVLNTPKKDDLADCFLQGIVYLKNKKIISYAHNLEINSMLLS